MRRCSHRALFLLASAMLALAMGVVCFFTFQSYGIVDRQVDAVMEADASDYLRLLSGSRWLLFFDGSSQHTLEREEQRKVLHHVAYFPVAEGFSRLLIMVAMPFGGMTPRTAFYAVNAILTVLNVLLLALLLQRLTPGASFAFVLLYASSLSTWVYGSLPDTWVLSGTFVLLSLLMAFGSVPTSIVALTLGLFMLNAFTLLAVILVLVPRFARASATTIGLLIRAAAVSLLAAAAWAAAMYTLGSVQPLFEVPRFLDETIDFRSGIPDRFPLLSPLRWGYSFVHMFVLSVIANQDRLNFSGGTVLRTVANVPFGTVGLSLYLVLLMVMICRLIRDAYNAVKRGSLRSLLSVNHVGCVLYVVAWYVVGTAGAHVDVLVYSPALLPVLILLFARYVGSATPTMRALSWTVAGLVLINSVVQVLRFRTALAAL